MPHRVIGGLVVLVVASACQAPGSTPTCNVMIDWVNFIEVGATQYVAGSGTDNDPQENELGSVYAQVKFKVNENVCDPGYRPKDGDAAFLEPGTPIYQVKGHPPTERLAARFNGHLTLYQALRPSPAP